MAAKMSFRAACFLLCVVVAASTEDLKDPTYYQFSAIKPGDEGSTHDTLEILIQYNGGGEVAEVKKILLYQSMSEDPEKNYIVAGVVPFVKLRFSGTDNYYLNAKLNNPRTKKSTFDLVWTDPESGYCRGYTAKVLVKDVNGEMHTLDKSIVVGAPAGIDCPADVLSPSSTETPDEQGEQTSHTEIPEYIQDAFPDATQEEREQILDKILSIDNNTYDVSGIYEGRVFIATMNDTNFELHKMNELCKSSGGYLAEVDSPEEENFIRDFTRSLRSLRYFIGANDVDNEGNFVYYNSKKPVTNVEWQKGEPNNGGGNEQCVWILKKGLNDKNCKKKGGYLCEIPLVDEPSIAPE